MNNDVSSSKFWDQCYINDNTGWDIGSVTPVFEDWCNKLQQKYSILIPGAGNGYDPLYFASKGHDVTAVDFSKEATNVILPKATSTALRTPAYPIAKQTLIKFFL